jgi:nucleoside-diphosphate-sugar epimerase
MASHKTLPMTILITGANGFVGRHLSAVLHEAGHKVICAVRDANKAVSNCDNRIVKNMAMSSHWDTALEGVEVVIHLIARTHSTESSRSQELALYRAVNVDITSALGHAIKRASVQHVIFMSSIKVHGETTGSEPFTEASTLQPEDAYGKTKLEAEQVLYDLLKETDKQLTIVRAPLIRGEDLKGNLATLEKAITRGVPLPFRSVRNARSIVTLATLGAFVSACIANRHDASGAFLVADTPPLSTAELISKIGDSIGIEPKLFAAPRILLVLSLTLIGRKDLINKLIKNLEVNATRSHSLLAHHKMGK